MAIHRTLKINVSPIKRQSLNSLSVNLSVHRLCKFLGETLHLYSNDSDSELRAAAVEVWKHLTEKMERCEINKCQNVLAQVNVVLNSFIASVRTELPATVIFEAYFLRGLVLETLHRSKAAVQPFMKALWIASSTADIPNELLAITTHHLGKCYGANGNYEDATKLLERSLCAYEQSHVPKHHSCVADAESTIRRLNEERKTVVCHGNCTLSSIAE